MFNIVFDQLFDFLPAVVHYAMRTMEFGVKMLKQDN